MNNIYTMDRLGSSDILLVNSNYSAYAELQGSRSTDGHTPWYDLGRVSLGEKLKRAILRK